MAANKSTVSSADLKNLKDFNKEASSLTTVLRELADALGKNAKEAAKFTGESAEAYKTSFSNAVSSAQELAGYTTKQLADKKTEAEFNKKLLKVEQERARIQSKISELEDKKINASKAELEYIEKTLKILRNVDDTIGDQIEHSGKLKKNFEEISKIDVFLPFKQIVEKIPILSSTLPKLTDASNKFRDSLAQGNSKMKSMGVGAKSLAQGLGELALGAVIGKAVDEFVILDERMVGMQRNLGVSRLEALKMNDAMIDASQASGKLYFNMERFQEAQEDINKTLGSNGAISADMAENFAALHHQMGLSTEEATKFSLTSMTMGKNAKDYTASITVQTKLLNGQKRLQIDNREIIKGVANTSSRVQLSYKASGQNLAQAVYQAKALGLNMSQVEKTADGLLDFESSIAAELEAELLSGKEYNLEKARGYALSNNMGKLATELGKQGITAASFGKMNRLEQEATAKMLGMQADELGDSLVLREQLKSVAKESGYRDAQSLEDLQKKVAMRAREIGMDKALAEIGDEKLRNQVDANTFAERAALDQKKATEKMIKLMGPEKLEKAMNAVDETIKNLIIAIQVLAALQVVSSIGSIIKGGINFLQSFKSVKLPTASPAASAASTGPKIKPNSLTTGASNAASSAGKSGGFMGKVGNFFGGIKNTLANTSVGKAVGGVVSKVGGVASKVGGVVGKLNPVKAASATMKGALKGLGKFLGPIMSIVSAIGSVYGEISSAKAQQAAGQQVDPGALGKRVVKGAAYPILNGAMNFLPVVGTAISIADGLLSVIGMSPLKLASDTLVDLVPTDFFAGLGNYILKPSAPAGEKKKMATGGIVNGATNAIVGEAGPEAVIPLTAFYAKLDELIAAVKQGGNIYVNQQKLNESAGLSMYRIGGK